MKDVNAVANPVLTEIRQLIEEARQRTAVAVNAELSLLYWKVGQCIRREVLSSDRAEYGKQVINNLSLQLTTAYGKGWSVRQLWLCIKFVDVLPDSSILHTLCAELTWSHIRLLIAIDDEIKRSFYMEMCRVEHWSVRQLDERIKSMLFERTAISKKPELTIQKDLQVLRRENRVSADLVFKDPYLLDFLGLADTYSEKDLESAILAELQRFICELDTDFAFIARQKRVTIDQRDYYIDLLFYHRRLKCLVAIDLKIGEFEAAHKGQMELYLRYLEKYEQIPGENLPIGLILCSGKNEEHIELLRLDQSNIRVADYLTQLPPKELLQEKLHRSIEIARSRFALAKPQETEDE